MNGKGLLEVLYPRTGFRTMMDGTIDGALAPSTISALIELFIDQSSNTAFGGNRYLLVQAARGDEDHGIHKNPVFFHVHMHVRMQSNYRDPYGQRG